MKKDKPKVSRKLKKALKQCIFYYDGFYLCLPSNYNKKTIRHTKWMHRVIGRYDPICMRACMSEEEREKHPITKNSKIIDRCISNIYYAPDKKKKRPTLKEWRLRGFIFTYSRNNIVYPKGAWIPKERPKEHYYKTANLNTKAYSVVHEVYDYKTRSHIVIERVPISQEEFADRELKAKYLFDAHIDRKTINDVEIL